MFNLNKITRKNIRNLKPYSSARDEFKGNAKIFLDANENAFGSLGGDDYNRYPDPLQLKLKKKIAKIKKVGAEQIFLGNGSDEVIDLLLRAFCNPGIDNVILMPPTYGMYKVAADTNDISSIEVPLNGDFDIDLENVLDVINEYTKLIFICSPNNPSGNRMNKVSIIRLLEYFHGIVIVDEAYIDYSDEKSLIDLLGTYANLVVIQTFSKARGMASLRVGIAFTNEKIINILNKIKPPYNINGLSQDKILEALERKTHFNDMVELVKNQRYKLAVELEKLSFTEKVYPSQANFVLAKFTDAKKIYNYLAAKGIIVRNRSNITGCSNTLRITIGKPRENTVLVNSLRQLDGKKTLNFDFDENNPMVDFLKRSARSSVLHRKTSETDIQINLDLDNSTITKIDTGIAFFDHMLEQIARHGGVGLNIKVLGDLEVDEHHTIEDTALALGEAFKETL
ncbi:MAG: histidinol-phosphate transaminase, partial [Bacteroidetes bacterium]